MSGENTNLDIIIVRVEPSARSGFLVADPLCSVLLSSLLFSCSPPPLASALIPLFHREFPSSSHSPFLGLPLFPPSVSLHPCSLCTYRCLLVSLQSSSSLFFSLASPPAKDRSSATSVSFLSARFLLVSSFSLCSAIYFLYLSLTFLLAPRFSIVSHLLFPPPSLSSFLSLSFSLFFSSYFSLSLSLYLSLFLSLFLSISLSIVLSLLFSLSIFLFLSFYLSLSFSFSSFFLSSGLARASPCFSAAACHAVGRAARSTCDDHAWAWTAILRSIGPASVPELAFPYTGNFVHDLSSAVRTSSPLRAIFVFLFSSQDFSQPPSLSFVERLFLSLLP